MQKLLSGSRKFGFERLESREMMAGNVALAFGAGSLQMLGDSKANLVAVFQSGGKTIVQGIGTQLTYGSKTGFSFSFSGVANLSADLAGGNDSFTLYNSTFAGGVAVQMGSGNDVLNMANVRASAIAVDLSSGDDVAAFVNVTLQSGFALNAGDGRDTVALNTVSVTATSGGMAVEMGPGNFDALAVANCSANAAAFDDGGGTNGTITGALNNFGVTAVANFKYRIGI